MPNWKKMAEAFGRAMNERVGKDTGSRRTINKSSIASDANEPGITGIKHPNSNEIASYRRGQVNGTENFYVGRDRANANAINNMDPTAKRIYDNYDFDFERAYGPDDAYRRAVELSGVEDAPSSPFEFEKRFGFDITEEPRPRTSDISRSISRVEDENSDARLAKDFEDAFNSAVERHGYDTWKKGSGDKPLDDGLNGEIHNLEREGAEDDIRAQMIEELKSGVDLSDFFEKYR